MLAQCLWPERSERARAHTLAEHAREHFAAGGEPFAERLAEVEAWLESHSGGPARQ